MSKIQRRVLQTLLTVLFFASLALVILAYGAKDSVMGIWNACNAAGALFVLAMVDTIPEE